MEFGFSEIQTVFEIEGRNEYALLLRNGPGSLYDKIGNVDLPGTYAIVQVSPDNELVQQWQQVMEEKYRAVE